MKAYKETVRKYYKFVYSTFEQPALTSDGKMGGSSWAVSCSGGNRGTSYTAFYPQTGSYGAYAKGGQPQVWLNMYTPKPTIITSFQYTATWQSGNVYVALKASLDGVNWLNLYSKTPLALGTQAVTLDNNVAFQYYQLNIQTTGGGTNDGVDVSGVRLFGQNRVVENSTVDNYDYYVDVQKFSAPKIDGKYYCSKF